MIEDIAASDAEAQKIHEIVKRQKFPPGVDESNFEVRFGEDATGSPAVWIVLKVHDKESIPSKERMSQLVYFANEVRDALIRERLRFWPYVNIKSAA